ncbi:MAG: hypothetical protein K2J20_04015, partial [Bacilli bacterium]|nr:hypothetical protein [Bacilli bacterium]
LIEVIRIKYFSRKKKIPKEMVNEIRNTLDKTIEEDKGSVKMMLQEIENVKKRLGKPSFDLIDALNRTYKLKLKMTADFNTIILAFQKAIKVVKLDGEKVETLKSAIVREGISKSVLGLPRLMFTIVENNLSFQYLVLMGIKTNGETKKTNLDSLEEQLYGYEVQMAKLINADYSIIGKNKEEFMRLYAQYLKLYANYIDDNLVDANYNKASRRIKDIIHNMYLYIDNSLAWLVQNEEDKPVVSTKKVVQEVKVNPLDEYIQNGVVVKYVSLDYFGKLLEASNLPVNRKDEYFRQMVNFWNRNKDAIIASLLGEFLEDEEMAIYFQAKQSSNDELKNVVKDIDAAGALMLDYTPEEVESFKDEIREYIGILESKIGKQQVDSGDIPKVLYFKTSDKRPFILEGLDNKSFKQVRISLNKIIDGKLDGDKKIGGLNSNFLFKAKGKNKKVVYMVINCITIIIGAFDDDDIGTRVNEVITSREFLNYMNEVLGFIKDGMLPNEREYTNNILDVLSGKNTTVLRA